MLPRLATVMDLTALRRNVTVFWPPLRPIYNGNVLVQLGMDDCKFMQLEGVRIKL